MAKSYDDYTPEDWAAQAKADEFDALLKSNGGDPAVTFQNEVVVTPEEDKK
jgi:hypothetical protein